MDRHGALTHLLPHLILAVAIYGLAAGDTRPLTHIAQLFLVVVAVDHFFDARKGTHRAASPPAARNATCSFLLWPIVPLHVALVLLGLAAAAGEGLVSGEFFAVTVTVGFVGAIFTIPAAHELIHRPVRAERLMGLTILTMFAYPHFAIEHVRGHHRHLGTLKDPATARLGESFFSFYQRALFDGVRSAWTLEARRLRQQQRRPFGIHNRLVCCSAVLLAMYSLVGLYFGIEGMAFMSIQSIIGFTTLEVINYIQHYGLVRRVLPSGRRERITAKHSWNSDHLLSNWLLLNLPRHADHHAEPAHGYRALRSIATAPQLPSGYFGLFLLALVPHLWRRVMDPKVRAWHEQRDGELESSNCAPGGASVDMGLGRSEGNRG